MLAAATGPQRFSVAVATIAPRGSAPSTSDSASRGGGLEQFGYGLGRRGRWVAQVQGRVDRDAPSDRAGGRLVDAQGLPV